MNEKRDHVRYTTGYRTGVKAQPMFKYELMDDHIVDVIQFHREGLAIILNISKGGCYIHCSAPLPLDTRLLITMVPPAHPRDRIIITGIVVRHAPTEHFGYYFGVHFIAYHEASQTILDNFVDFLSQPLARVAGRIASGV